MYSYVPDCVLYSYDEPCETCDAVDFCLSNCTGRATYLKRECDVRRLFRDADPPSPPSSLLSLSLPPVQMFDTSPPPLPGHRRLQSTPSPPPPSYQYVRWSVTDMRKRVDRLGVGEFELSYLGTALNMASATVTNPGGNNPNHGLPSNLVNGVLDNFFDLDIDVNSFTSVLKFDFGNTPVLFDAYAIATAIACPGRDPRSWTLAVSDDDVTYTDVHEVIDRYLTLSRSSWTTFEINAPPPPPPSTYEYRYLMWEIHDIRKRGKSKQQMSEFRLLNNGNAIDLSSVTVTNPGGSNPNNEQPPNAVDGSVHTKWLDFDIDSPESFDCDPSSQLVLDFGVGNVATFDEYTWATANDVIGRDPISWSLFGSQDGSNWIELHRRFDVSITKTRKTFVGTFRVAPTPPLPPPPSPPPAPTSPPPTSPPPPPMACTLDFARYDPNYPGDIEMSPDGLLTTEFTLIEHYALLGAEGRHNDDYWCDALTRPELQCLDIGAPSTLGGSLNVSRTTDGSLIGNNMLIYDVQETANATSDALFGQYDRCHGRLVGDGVIDVFDMATMLSYIFGDWRYGDLAQDPHTVFTTQGRRAAASLCGQGFTRQDYAEQYTLDTCMHTDGAIETGGRRLAEAHFHAVSSSRRVVGVYLRSCGTYEHCVIVDRPVYMIFISILDSSYGANVTGVGDATVHRHAAGVVLSRGQYGGGTLAPIDGGVRRIVVPPHARLGRVEAYASATEELSVIARPSFPVRWSDYVAYPPLSSLPPSVSPRNGYWTTFDMTIPVSRLHAVFVQRFDAHLSMRPFVVSDRPGWNEVRVTRHCAPERCDFCASIETGLNAVHHGTLEMFQTPIHSSCAYSVHVYASETVTLQYAIATTSRDFHPPAWSSITCLVQRSSEGSPPLHSLLPSFPPAPPKTPLHLPPPSMKSRMSIWISVGLVLWSAALCVFVARMRTSPPPRNRNMSSMGAETVDIDRP